MSTIFGSAGEVEWAVLDAKTQRFSCRRCGSSEGAPMGLLIIQFSDICDGFVRRHAACELCPACGHVHPASLSPCVIADISRPEGEPLLCGCSIGFSRSG